jgi:hypothetical protein
MRLIHPRSFAAAVAVLGALGIAAAQTEPAGGTPPPTAAVTTPREVPLTPAQRLEEAGRFLQKMEQASTTVRRQLEQARAARDVVKVLCLNDKLNQIDVATRSARDRVGPLKSAVERGDEDRSRHEFAVLQVLNDRVATLVSEANQCIGEETGFIGDSQITVNIDPEIPDNDPDQIGVDPEIIEGPVLSSPIR